MIIGLCGYKGSGKSEVAKYLAKNHGFRRVNFKDGLVEEMKANLVDTLEAIKESYNEHLFSDEVSIDKIDMLFEMKPPIMRALMQNYGTEVRRKDKESYWVDKWIEKAREAGGNIVTDDVRFYNELSALGGEDGVLIRIAREDITTGGTHASETEQEKFIEDFTIVAKPGDLDSVFKQVESILETIKNNND